MSLAHLLLLQSPLAIALELVAFDAILFPPHLPIYPKFLSPLSSHLFVLARDATSLSRSSDDRSLPSPHLQTLFYSADAAVLVNIKDTTGDIGIGFPGARLPPFITAAAISGLIIFTDIFFTAYYALSGIFEAFAVNLMAANQTSLELEKISHKQGLPVDYGSLTLAEMTVVLVSVSAPISLQDMDTC